MDNKSTIMTGKVLNIKYDPFLNPDYIYIGRANKMLNLPASIWQNPFVIGKDGTREEVITKYEKYIRNNPTLMNKIKELKDKTLVCWCKPLACHGDVLIKLVKEYEDDHTLASGLSNKAIKLFEIAHFQMKEQAKIDETK